MRFLPEVPNYVGHPSEDSRKRGVITIVIFEAFSFHVRMTLSRMGQSQSDEIILMRVRTSSSDSTIERRGSGTLTRNPYSHSKSPLSCAS